MKRRIDREVVLPMKAANNIDRTFEKRSKFHENRNKKTTNDLTLSLG